MRNKILHILFFTLIFSFFWIVIHRQLFLPRGMRDTAISAHVAYSWEIAHGHRRLPHQGFFHAVMAVQRLSGWSYPTSGLLVLSSCATLTALVMYWTLRFRLPSMDAWKLLLGTLLLMTVGALYLLSFNRAVYFGQGSPTMWHNGTVIALKPVALIAFTMNVALINGGSFGRWRVLLLGTAIMNAITVYIKPTFLIAFAPALVMYTLARRARLGRNLGLCCIVFLPAILVLVYEHSQFYDAAGRRIGFVLLTVWRLFTPSVLVSILLALAFPLSIAYGTWPRVVNNPLLSTAWFMTFVGIAQFAFIAEFIEENRPLHTANWIGAYLIAQSVLFLFSMEEYLRWFENIRTMNGAQLARFAVASLLLAWHWVSGCYYLSELIIHRRATVIWYGDPY